MMMMEIQTPRRLDIKAVENPDSTQVISQRAIRFDIVLMESTNDKCPEISYSQLLVNYEREHDSKGTGSGIKTSLHHTKLGVGDVQVDEVEALARRMEEKYGKSAASASAVDLGEGYDSDDSFIDNDEAYDELVPSTLTTQYGGFYINSGLLDFREVSSDELPADEEVRKTKKRRTKAVKSDSDESSEEKQQLKNKKVALDAVEQPQSGSDGGPVKRKKMSPADDNHSKKKRVLTAGAVALSGKDSSKYDSIIDDVIKGAMSSSSEPRKKEGDLKRSSLSDAVATVTHKSKEPAVKEVKEVVKLPEPLPEACKTVIQFLQQTAVKCTAEKTKFFTAEVNDALLRLDNEARGLHLSHRTVIYSFLSSYLPINRETLMKRIKQLRQKEVMMKLKEPIEKLKAAINDEMPNHISKYNFELLARQQSRIEDLERSKDDSLESEDESDQRLSETGGQREEVEGQKLEVSAPGVGNQSGAVSDKPNDRKRERCITRKKFEWTEMLRNCLCEVVAIKMGFYDSTKVKGQTAEDFLKDFLENDLRPLWPKGWMQMRVLYKESRVAHSKWTGSAFHFTKQQPAKKPSLITSAIKMATSLSSSSKKLTSPMSAGDASMRCSKSETQSVAACQTLQTSKSVASSVENLTSAGYKTITVKCSTASSAAGKSPSAVTLAASPPTPNFVQLSAQRELSCRTSALEEVDDKPALGKISNLVASQVKSATSPVRCAPRTSTCEQQLGIAADLLTSSAITADIAPDSSPSRVAYVTQRSAAQLGDKEGNTFVEDGLAEEISPSSVKANVPLRPKLMDEQKRRILVNQKKIAEQKKQAVATLALQQTKALQQQHLAACLASQQKMLQHKKMASNLMTQQKLVQQQQIASIVSEHKMAQSLAVQQRLVQQQQIAQQQKLAQQQKMLQQRQAQAQKLAQHHKMATGIRLIQEQQLGGRGGDYQPSDQVMQQRPQLVASLNQNSRSQQLEASAMMYQHQMSQHQQLQQHILSQQQEKQHQLSQHHELQHQQLQSHQLPGQSQLPLQSKQQTSLLQQQQQQQAVQQQQQAIQQHQQQQSVQQQQALQQHFVQNQPNPKVKSQQNAVQQYPVISKQQTASSPQQHHVAFSPNQSASNSNARILNFDSQQAVMMTSPSASSSRRLSGLSVLSPSAPSLSGISSHRAPDVSAYIRVPFIGSSSTSPSLGAPMSSASSWPIVHTSSLEERERTNTNLHEEDANTCK